MVLAGCSNSNFSQTKTSVSNQTNISQSLNKAQVTDSQKQALATHSNLVKQLLPPNNPDDNINAKVGSYIGVLASQGFTQEHQGVWIQTDDKLLANHQGTTPLPAASVTKVATTLAALQTFGPQHRFVTKIGATGPIENGVLKGDLVVEGGKDPLFIWEEAVAVGNALNKLGIQKVAGDLIIAGNFYMNFETKPETTGTWFKEGINTNIWPAEAEQQYLSLPVDTPRPEVEIEGNLKIASSPPSSVTPLLQHQSPTLAELLKKMNQYSNNYMAQMLADAVGPASIVAQKAAEGAGVPQAEIQLINGSGLGEENKISPRAAVRMFQAIEAFLKPYNMTVADVVAVIGQDQGVLEGRPLPKYAVIKTGTLDNVSSLAGVIPTQQGYIWVAIMNGGLNQEGFRQQQEVLLNTLLTTWGAVSALPNELSPQLKTAEKISKIEIMNN